MSFDVSVDQFQLAHQNANAYRHLLSEIARGADGLENLFKHIRDTPQSEFDSSNDMQDPVELLRPSTPPYMRAQIRIYGASLLDYILVFSPSEDKMLSGILALARSSGALLVNARTLDMQCFFMRQSKNCASFTLALPAVGVNIAITSLNCLDMAAVCLSHVGVRIALTFDSPVQTAAAPLLLSARTPCFAVCKIIALLATKSTLSNDILPLAISAAIEILKSVLPRLPPQQLVEPLADFANMSFQQITGLLFSVAATAQRLGDIVDLFHVVLCLSTPSLALPPAANKASDKPTVLGWICSSTCAAADDDTSRFSHAIFRDLLSCILRSGNNVDLFDVPCMNFQSFQQALSRHDVIFSSSAPDDMLQTSQKLLLLKGRLGDTMSRFTRLTPDVVATVFGNIGILQAMPLLSMRDLLQLCGRLGYPAHLRIFDWLWSAFVQRETDRDKQGEMLKLILVSAVPAEKFDAHRTAVLRSIGIKANEFDHLKQLCGTVGLSDVDQARLRGETLKAAAPATSSSKQTTTVAAAGTGTTATFSNQALKAAEKKAYTLVPASFVNDYNVKNSKVLPKSGEPTPSLKREIMVAWEKLSDNEKQQYQQPAVSNGGGRVRRSRSPAAAGGGPNVPTPPAPPAGGKKAAATPAPANTGGVNDQPTPEFLKGFRSRIGQVGGRLSKANIAKAMQEWLAQQNGGGTGGAAAAPAATPAAKAPAAAPAATPAAAKKASPKKTSPKKAKAATAATGAASTAAAKVGGKNTPAPAPKKKPAAKGGKRKK